MNIFRYRWKEEIWALHLELQNEGGESARARVCYEGSGTANEFTVPGRETMRFNLCRFDGQNGSLRLELPPEFRPRIYENLDRAFYTDIPSPDLEELSD